MILLGSEMSPQAPVSGHPLLPSAGGVVWGGCRPGWYREITAGWAFEDDSLAQLLSYTMLPGPPRHQQAELQGPTTIDQVPLPPYLLHQGGPHPLNKP